MRYRDIMEMPEIIPSVDWNLEDPKSNALVAKSFHNYSSETFRDYQTATLFIQMGNVGGQIGLISKITGLLEYYVNYETSKDTNLGNCATQVKLWRSRFASIKNLSSIGFEEILLSRFDTIISDRTQTSRGQEFWCVQISHYCSSKVVGFIDYNGIHCYGHNKPIADWIAEKNAWGKGKSFRNKKFFISNLEKDTIEKS